jgi:carboxylesterase type B
MYRKPSITQVAVPDGYPDNPTPTFDEFNCLNLNIIQADTNATNLPVMVWIHGGGFAVGANTDNVMQGVNLVQSSVERREPIVFVAIQ